MDTKKWKVDQIQGIKYAKTLGPKGSSHMLNIVAILRPDSPIWWLILGTMVKIRIKGHT